MVIASLAYANANNIAPLPETTQPVVLEEDKTKIGLGFSPFFTTETNFTDKQALPGMLPWHFPFGEDKYGFKKQKNKQITNSLNAELNWVHSFNFDNRGQYIFSGIDVIENKQKLIESFSYRLIVPMFHIQMIEYSVINYSIVYVVPGINWAQGLRRCRQY